MLGTFTPDIQESIQILLNGLYFILGTLSISTVAFIYCHYNLSFPKAVTDVMRYAITRKKEDEDFSIIDIQWYLSCVYSNIQYLPALERLFSNQNEKVISKYLEKKHFYDIVDYYNLNRDIVKSHSNPLTIIFPNNKMALLNNIKKVNSELGVSGENEAIIFHVLKENGQTNCTDIKEFARLFLEQFQNAVKTPKWVAQKYDELFKMDSGNKRPKYLSDDKLINLYENIKSLITIDLKLKE